MTLNYAHLSDIELLGRLIGVQESQRVYQGSLRDVFAEGPELCQVARALVQRLLDEEIRMGDVLNSPGTVRDYLRLTLQDLPHEVFMVIFLDAQFRVIEAEEMFRGTLTQTSVYPREVVKAALRLNAAAVILAHNHPSGSDEPSSADRQLTTALKQALALVDVRVLDHLVVAGERATSFAERGLM